MTRILDDISSRDFATPGFSLLRRATSLGAAAALMAALVAPMTSQAQATTVDQKFLASKNCLSCHSVQRKIVGPAFKDIATKYAGHPEVADKLAEKIRKGGSGVWGPIPMPANPKVNEAEAKQLAEWVLAQPPR